MRTTYRALLVSALAALAGSVLAGYSPALGATPAADRAASIVASFDDSRVAGFHRDASGAIIVNVTDEATARAVRASGLSARVVTRSARELNRIMNSLDPAVAGTAWSVDAATNQIVVDVDPTVTGARLAEVQAAVSRAGGAARIERVSTRLSLTISGGDAIYGGGFRCSLGFNVRKGTTFFFLTAGHCTDAASEWFSNSSHSTKLGDRTGTSFPGNDYGIVRYTNTSIAIDGSVGGQDITAAGDAFVGQSVQRRGSTTGTRSGSVTGLNATVHYAEGTVRGMIRTNVCAEPGDSGGPLYANSIALGLTSGGSGNCQSGGTTFFQPVKEALSKYKVEVF